MITLKRRDPSLSIRAAQAARLASNKRDRLAGRFYSEIKPVLQAERLAASYLNLAAAARMFGL
jgi:hypothetical protein